jgi:hypothetical protein
VVFAIANPINIAKLRHDRSRSERCLAQTHELSQLSIITAGDFKKAAAVPAK